MEHIIEHLETEHGIFTNNIITGQSAQEVYDEWLLNKDKPPIVEPTEVEILQAKVETLEQQKQELQYRVESTEAAVLDLMLNSMNL